MNQLHQSSATEKEIISNYKPNYLYWHDFKDGRFFQVVHDDEKYTIIKFASKTMLKIVYINDRNDIEGYAIIKTAHDKDTQRVKLSKFNFVQLKAFLSFISEINLKDITENRLRILDDQGLDQDTIRSVKTLLSKNGGAELVETLIHEGIISSKDIVNTAFRKKGLQIFKDLKDDLEYWKIYAEQNQLNLNSEEKVWQYFFDNNQWIFGYGLDYRYQEILQKEVHYSETNLDGSNAVIGDFLLGDNSFTTFVEIKKPSTKLFGNIKNRVNSWKLSNALIESVSQILEHKASGLIRFSNQQFINGNQVKQKSYDSKVILIIGDWKELEESSDELEREIKKKTLELFRRDSKNIEILTFDELYERACFIAEGEKK